MANELPTSCRPLPPHLDKIVSNATGLRHQTSRRYAFGLVWCAFSIVATSLTWYFHAKSTKGGLQKAKDYWEVELLRISYMGAFAPAYYVFCTCVPVGCFLLLEPVEYFLATLDRVLLRDLGLPTHSCCRCFLCCCCSCIDSARFEAPEPDWPPPFHSAPRHCTISPYLPYSRMAFRPLFKGAIWGLAILAVAPLGFRDLISVIHALSAFYFFYGMLAMSGLWTHFQTQAVALWPKRSKELGLNPASSRFAWHRRFFALQASVMLLHDWLALVVVVYLDVNHGVGAPRDFHYRYSTALSQWAVGCLVMCMAACFTFDMDALETAQKELSRSGLKITHTCVDCDIEIGSDEGVASSQPRPPETFTPIVFKRADSRSNWRTVRHSLESAHDRSSKELDQTAEHLRAFLSAAALGGVFDK